jgi:NADPH:quinone reductase-like Zn-dependent oxidoreductase
MADTQARAVRFDRYRDLAGVVIAVGPDAGRFAVGDEVLGWSWRRSSHATHTAVPVG